MNIDTILFYLFSSFALVSALMVTILSNAVHSVLFLIIVFCNIVGLLLLLGAEFLSFMFLIVYIGAIAVLFLFVVMMLNIKISNLNINRIFILPIGSFISLILLSYIFSLLDITFEFYNIDKLILLHWISWITENSSLTNIESIGNVLYTKFSFLFLICGLILLVAMIGAISLTMHQRINVKKQNVNLQVVRDPKNVVKFIILRK
uniref:NADH-ubiquinone oxidoreductase chain 6 n=1 Tax=Rhodogorgon sp. TaxID=2485824 RepID=A0A3G3MIN0_9FLOR|nr:NADH dehydrogenase subunit 6 [Rhodogorgon sp.]